MFDAALAGLLGVLQWPAIGYLAGGVLLGLYFGAVPGLSGLTGLALLIPFTFGMEPTAAIAMLLGLLAVTTTSDSIGAVLIGVPGTSAAAATVVDGHPMARRGEAARALGAAFTSSAVGGVIGAVVLALSLPIVQPLLRAFAQPEIFMLGVLGLTMVGTLSSGSMVKGLAVASFGVLLSTVGYSPQGGMSRFDFGIATMRDGLPMVSAILGLFALPELVDLIRSKQSISGIGRAEVRSGILRGVVDTFRHWWLVVRCSLIGVYIGLLPGSDGSVVDWVAYGHTVQSSKDRSQFGKGDVRGVIGPECANNSMKGGALIPTIAFGIPGSAGTALFLGGLLILGLTPGPAMLTTNLHITFGMVWALALANVLGAVLLMLWANQVVKIAFVRAGLIAPAIIVFVLLGAWSSSADMNDWITMLVFGAAGVVMKAAGWPRSPLVLGLLIGSIMETALDISIQSYGFSWVSRPITLVIALIALITVLSMIVRGIRSRAKPAVNLEAGTDWSVPASIAFGVVCTLVIAGAVAMALGWASADKFSPLSFAVPALLLSIAAVALDARRLAASVHARGGGLALELKRDLGDGHALRSALGTFGWLIGIVLASVLVGQLIAFPLFLVLYLRFAARESWRLALLYGAVGGAFIYIVFDRLVHVNWYPSWLFG